MADSDIKKINSFITFKCLTITALDCNSDEYSKSKESLYLGGKTKKFSSSTNVPASSLYSSEDKKSKISLLELAMYSMTSLLASVGAGYDVRLSATQNSLTYGETDDFPTSNLNYDKSKKRLISNTYHGAVKHIR